MGPRALRIPDKCRPVELHTPALSFLLSISPRFSPACLDMETVLYVTFGNVCSFFPFLKSPKGKTQ